MDYYSYMQLSDMMFTVSLLSKDIASVIKDKIVVTGDELEMYLHQTSDTKNRYVFDGTRFSGMHTHGFHKQVPLMSQKSRFDLSSQTGYNESYQLEESNGYGKQDPPKENMFTLIFSLILVFLVKQRHLSLTNSMTPMGVIKEIYLCCLLTTVQIVMQR